MFTGLVAAVGQVEANVPRDGGQQLTVHSPWDDLVAGESVAVDGACLTVTAVRGSSFDAHVIVSSLDRTLFGAYRTGRRVNLERALRVGDRLGGHIVQGHVDGVAEILAVVDRDDARLLDLAVPASVALTSVPLGSITVDGVSLTVNALPTPEVVQVSLIPFTLEHTTLGERRPGDRVHVEGDAVGKYVRQMIDTQRTAREG